MTTKPDAAGDASPAGMVEREWERRFKARIMAALSPFKREGHKGPGWTQAQAEQMAQDEYSGLSDIDLRDDPEDAADESMSYWGDGA